MRRLLPAALTTLRLLLGPVVMLCALANAPRLVYLPILIAGTLSDIFDGVLARRLGVATPMLRRYDSVADVVYYLLVLAAVWILRKLVIIGNARAIGLLLFSEAAAIAVSFVRFRKYPATHSYLAKFYGLCLLAATIALLVYSASSWAITTLVVVAVAANAEIIVILLLAEAPPVDVHSVFFMRRGGG